MSIDIRIDPQRATFSATGTITDLNNLTDALALWDRYQNAPLPASLVPGARDAAEPLADWELELLRGGQDPDELPVAVPKVTAYHVGKHTQVHVNGDTEHGCYWVCSCEDFRYRRQSAPGLPACQADACKHIYRARLVHAQIAMSRLGSDTYMLLVG